MSFGAVLPFLAPVLFAAQADPAAGKGATLRLAAVDRFFEVGRPARVRVTLANEGKASLLTDNAVLFGVGITATGADGVAKPVTESLVPANCKQPLLLPSGASVAATIDLASLLPTLFEKRGKVSVKCAVAGVESAPLEFMIHPDWRGGRAVIETSHGAMELEFFPERAPTTVANFLELAETGFYDGLTFHRVVKGFMVQGGCPNGDGTGDGPSLIPLEAGRGADALKHERGTISMAHKADPNSGSCQFFLCHRAQPALDGNYAAFGRIVDGGDGAGGLATLDKIAEVPCAMVPGGPDPGPSRPKEKVTITKVRLVAPDAKRGG